MTVFVDDICKKCWGSRTIIDPGNDRDAVLGPRVQCPRCRGTGEEPDTFSWPLLIFIIVVFMVGLFAVWGVK